MIVETQTGPKSESQDAGGQSAFYSRHNTVPLPLIERASGIHMWDSEGNRYIEVSSGPIVSNIGHGNADVATAMAAQAETMDYAFARLARNRPNIEFANRLSKLAGPGFERVHLVSGGSEAMENAIKFLRQYALATGRPEKRRIITLQPSYHGATVATLAMNGERLLEPFLDGFALVSEKVPAPMTYRRPMGYDAAGYARHCAGELEKKIKALGAENVLAFVMEPIGGLSTGCAVPPAGYVHAVREICTRYGVYLVFDEILCGTGRTGKYLACHHWPDARPDIITMAKGLASGYSPLGAVLAPAAMVDELAGLSGFEFQYSYNASPVSSAAGLAVMDVYDCLDLVTAASERGARIRAGLEALKRRNPLIGDIRGMGLLMAVELVADQETKQMLPNRPDPTDRIRIHGMDNGLMIYSRPTSGGQYGHWFIVAPPLIITEAECDDLLARLAATLDDVHAAYKKDGLL